MHPDPRKNGRQPESAELIAGHDDLLMQILLLLPAKSLVRFKSVCKHWRTLISDASFPRLHLLNHGRRSPDRRHSFILGLSCVKSQYLVCSPDAKKLTPLAFPSDKTRILQSSNGLLLLENGVHHCVLNPTTMQYRELVITNPNVDKCFLSFDPSQSDRYRVFRFDCLDRFNVYDSAAKNWEFRRDFQFQSYGKGISCGSYVYIFENSHASYLTPQGLMYDNIPPCPKRGCRGYIMESNGHLHYIRLSLTKILLEVYELIGGKWILCKSADRDQLRATLGSEKVELLGMIREGKVEDSMFLVHVPGRIMIYRFSDWVCEVIDDFRSQYFYKKDQLQFLFKDAHLFVPSFAPV